MFQRIYDTASLALAPDCADRCGAVLDAYSLVDAVLCTQGVVDVEGGISGIPLTEGGVFLANAPYSALAPLLEALTTTGSGHYSTVVEIHDKQPELFQDYRLKNALVKGLGASYSELAEQVETWLCEEGESIVPILKRDLNPKGKKEMVRRVRVIESIRKEKDNGYYISLLDTAEKEVREAVIYALRHDKGNTQLLLDLTKAEKGNCKKAAQSALISMDAPEALKYWQDAMKKNPGAAAPFLALSHSDAMSDLLAAALENVTDRLLEYAQEKKPVPDTDIAVMDNLLGSVAGKSSPAMCSWYRRAAQNSAADAIDSLLNSRNKPARFYSYSGWGYQSGYYNRDGVPFVQMVPSILTHSIICFPDKRLFALADELFESVGAEYFKPALVSALFTQPAPEVYDRFVPYLEGRVKGKFQSICVKAFQNILEYLNFNVQDTGEHELEASLPDPFYNSQKKLHYVHSLYEPLDHRWFRLIVSGKMNTSSSPYYIGRLIDPKDPIICEIMGEYYYKRALDPSIDSRSTFSYLKTCGWVGEKCKGIITAGMKKPYNHDFYNFQNLVDTAPLNCSQKADEVEEVRELVLTHKINVRGWDDQKVQEMCAKLRASGNAFA